LYRSVDLSRQGFDAFGELFVLPREVRVALQQLFQLVRAACDRGLSLGEPLHERVAGLLVVQGVPKKRAAVSA
jgi:hypothetical protein